MKKIILLTAVLFYSLFAAGQKNVNLVIFSEDGDPFYTYINGVKQNDKPETNVKVTGVSPNISLRIEFEDKALPQLKQTMALEPGFEHTARIKRDLKQQVKLRYFGQTPLNNETTPGVATVQYHSTENVATEPAHGNNNVTGHSVTSTTTTTTHTRGNDNAAVNMNMAGVGISMNVTGMDGGSNVNSTTSTTVTQTSSYSGSSSAVSETNDHASGNSVMPAKTGCGTAMTPGNFNKMKQSVESKPFSDTKMSTAKVATKNSCLSVDQVKTICKLFSMDEDKLTYAKYAYDYCVDKGNYYQVSEVFSFSSTADDLNKFLEQ